MKWRGYVRFMRLRLPGDLAIDGGMKFTNK